MSRHPGLIWSRRCDASASLGRRLLAAKMRVMTVVGTRPELIRLSLTIEKLDRYCDHHLVHTGQNYDYELNQIFFEDLGIRAH